MKIVNYTLKYNRIIFNPVILVIITLLTFSNINSQDNRLKINDIEYFETTGLNVLVFSTQNNGFFFDEKTAGIELIHHGIRTAIGGALLG